MVAVAVGAAGAGCCWCREHGLAEDRKHECDGLRDGEFAVWDYPSKKNANKKQNWDFFGKLKTLIISTLTPKISECQDTIP